MFTFKDRQPKHLKSNLVYEISCSCGRRYVGETCRALKTRFEEHMKTSGSGITEVGKHLSSSPTCKITFEDCRVLTYESNQYRRKLKESLFIQQYDDGTLINDKMASVPLFLFSLPSYQDQLKGRVFPSFTWTVNTVCSWPGTGPVERKKSETDHYVIVRWYIPRDIASVPLSLPSWSWPVC